MSEDMKTAIGRLTLAGPGRTAISGISSGERPGLGAKRSEEALMREHVVRTVTQVPNHQASTRPIKVGVQVGRGVAE